MVVYSVLVVMVLIGINVDADIYMHSPRGSNNRLDGENRERRNANRLFDSQNNNRGGYNVGGDGDEEGEASMTYIAGSKLDIEWTNQHQCGGENTNCDIIMQYMCEGAVRDGTTTNTIPARLSEADRSSMKKYGRHESQDYYADCASRSRNRGLFTADQKVRGNSATYTRQNPDGKRRGLECAEERDYYPTPIPSPWKDIVILAGDTERCTTFKEQSQNVLAKPFCSFNDNREKENAGRNRNANAKAPLSKADCDANPAKFKWTESPAHNLDAPECIEAPKSRDNHLGNTEATGTGSERIPQTLKYTWTVPDLDEAKCVLRMRYNISIGDFPYALDALGNELDEKCLPSVPVGADYGIESLLEEDQRGYFLENNPKIEPLRTEALGIVNKLKLQLAINTAQTGRVFQDRSHTFAIKKRENVPANADIYNLNVRGKRGNIVQVYPATEYDFTPNNLVMKRGDYLHPQWTGSLKNPNNNDGEGRNKEDKSNIISLANRNYGGNQPANTVGYPGNSYPQSIQEGTFLGLDKAFAQAAAFPTNGKRRDEPKREDMLSRLEDEVKEIKSILAGSPEVKQPEKRGNNNGDAAVLDNAPAHVDLGPQKAATKGKWSYMCTRNNNFSNRSQKGRIIVK